MAVQPAGNGPIKTWPCPICQGESYPHNKCEPCDGTGEFYMWDGDLWACNGNGPPVECPVCKILKKANCTACDGKKWVDVYKGGNILPHDPEDKPKKYVAKGMVGVGVGVAPFFESSSDLGGKMPKPEYQPDKKKLEKLFGSCVECGEVLTLNSKTGKPDCIVCKLKGVAEKNKAEYNQKLKEKVANVAKKIAGVQLNPKCGACGVLMLKHDGDWYCPDCHEITKDGLIGLKGEAEPFPASAGKAMAQGLMGEIKEAFGEVAHQCPDCKEADITMFPKTSKAGYMGVCGHCGYLMKANEPDPAPAPPACPGCYSNEGVTAHPNNPTGKHYFCEACQGYFSPVTAKANMPTCPKCNTNEMVSFPGSQDDGVYRCHGCMFLFKPDTAKAVMPACGMCGTNNEVVLSKNLNLINAVPGAPYYCNKCTVQFKAKDNYEFEDEFKAQMGDLSKLVDSIAVSPEEYDQATKQAQKQFFDEMLSEQSIAQLKENLDKAIAEKSSPAAATKKILNLIKKDVEAGKFDQGKYEKLVKLHESASKLEADAAAGKDITQEASKLYAEMAEQAKGPMKTQLLKKAYSKSKVTAMSALLGVKSIPEHAMMAYEKFLDDEGLDYNFQASEFNDFKAKVQNTIAAGPLLYTGLTYEDSKPIQIKCVQVDEDTGKGFDYVFALPPKVRITYSKYLKSDEFIYVNDVNEPSFHKVMGGPEGLLPGGQDKPAPGKDNEKSLLKTTAVKNLLEKKFGPKAKVVTVTHYQDGPNKGDTYDICVYDPGVKTADEAATAIYQMGFHVQAIEAVGGGAYSVKMAPGPKAKAAIEAEMHPKFTLKDYSGHPVMILNQDGKIILDPNNVYFLHDKNKLDPNLVKDFWKAMEDGNPLKDKVTLLQAENMALKKLVVKYHVLRRASGSNREDYSKVRFENVMDNMIDEDP